MPRRSDVIHSYLKQYKYVPSNWPSSLPSFIEPAAEAEFPLITITQNSTVQHSSFKFAFLTSTLKGESASLITLQFPVSVGAIKVFYSP